jgi:hypothetical protein
MREIPRFLAACLPQGVSPGLRLSGTFAGHGSPSMSVRRAASTAMEERTKTGYSRPSAARTMNLSTPISPVLLAP